MELTLDQVIWLSHQGGRSMAAVKRNHRGLYIEMYHPKKEFERVYLPGQSLK